MARIFQRGGDRGYGGDAAQRGREGARWWSVEVNVSAVGSWIDGRGNRARPGRGSGTVPCSPQLANAARAIRPSPPRPRNRSPVNGQAGIAFQCSWTSSSPTWSIDIPILPLRVPLLAYRYCFFGPLPIGHAATREVWRRRVDCPCILPRR
jgi:hypothetical protein